MTQEALKLALEALEAGRGGNTITQRNKAITAIKEKLAQPPVAKPHEQEPVVCGWWEHTSPVTGIKDVQDWQLTEADKASGWIEQPLYTTLPPAAVQHERKPLTSPDIRKWWSNENGLEDCNMAKLDDFEQVVRAIEAAHGIKE